MADSPFSSFTSIAQETVVLAQEASRSLHYNYIGSEHLLLALLRQDGEASDFLLRHGLSADLVERQVERIVGVGREEDAVDGQIPFTPRAKEILERAQRAAVALGAQVEPLHILLGLAEEGEGIAARVLLDFDLTPPSLYSEVHQLLLEKSSRGGSPDEPPSPTSEEESSAEVEPVIERVAPEPVPTHSDQPAVDDELGRIELAEVLAERIRRVRGENTELPTRSLWQQWAKRRQGRSASRKAGSFMVHLYAPWGGGKSSVLNFLAADLRNRQKSQDRHRLGRILDFLVRPRRPAQNSLSRWVVINFSAWEHQRLGTPWWWLLAEVQRSGARELWRISRPRWLWFWIRDLAWRLWNARAAIYSVLLAAVLLLIGLINDWFGLDLNSLSALQTVALTAGTVIALATTLAGLALGAGRWLGIGSADGAVRFLRKAHDPLGVYRRRFRWLVRSCGHPMAVFIDDLDRCRANYVVELLEGVQTVFGGQPVTYVVAADRTWLYESFGSGYEEFDGVVGEAGRPLGILFLEKTFQISLEIAPMSSHTRKRFWSTLIGDDRPDSTPAGPPAATWVDTFSVAQSQEEVEGMIDSLLQEGVNEDQIYSAAVRRLNAPDLQRQLEQQLENLLNDFSPFLENNPRAMKRLVNAYGIERDRLLRSGFLLTPSERRTLIMLTILRLRWPTFADHLRLHPGDIDFCTGDAEPATDHPYASLFSNPDVRALFEGRQFEEQLDATVLDEFPNPRPR